MLRLSSLLVGLLATIHVTSSLDCQDGIIRGVNTGGWLLLEPWITPYLFEEVNYGENLDKIVDEYTYAQYVDPVFYKERLKLHWNSFVQREDFEKVSSAGVTHVRIPVGYWYWDVIEGEPFPAPNMDDSDPYSPLFYLRRALIWLEELGMKAEIDLHGGPGSQNGFDNSGKRGDIGWVSDAYPSDNTNVARTLAVIDKMAATLKIWVDAGIIQQDTLYGVCLLNEPGGWWDKVWDACTEEFYPSGYDIIRGYFPEESFVVNFQQAFKSQSDWVGLFPESDGYSGVSVDWHNYQCFGDYWNQLADLPEGWVTHLEASCSFADGVANYTLPTFTGEFCLAVTNCQKYLDGGFHTPYEPPSVSEQACAYYNSDWVTYSDAYKEFLGQYFLAQIDAFEYGANGVGWFMWTMKTENNCAPEWDFIFLLEHGIIPADLCNREKFCSF